MMLPEYLIGGVYTVELYSFLESFLSGLSIFLLLFYLFRRYSSNIRFLISFLGFAIVSTIIPFQTLYVLFLSMTVFFLVKLAEAYNLKNRIVFWSMLTVSIALLFSFTGEAYLIQNLAFLLVLFLAFSIFYIRKGFKLRDIFITLGALFIAIIMSASMFTYAYTLSSNEYAYANYYIFAHAAERYSFGFPNIIDSLLNVPYNAASVYVVANSILFLIAISGLMLIKFKDKGNARLYLALIATIVLLVILHNRIAMPFGNLFMDAVKVIPQLYAIRYGFGNWVVIQTFIISILVGFVVAKFYDLVEHKKLVYALIAVALVCTVPAAYYNYFLPYTNTNYYVKIPNHVYLVSDYINNMSGDFNVATLPSAAGFQYLENWYTGPDIYSYLINKPVFTGGYIAQTEIFYPITKYLYDSVAGSIDTSNLTNNRYIPRLFGVLGIKYIIVQGNAVQSSPYDIDYFDSFSFNYIYSNLNLSNNITFVKRYSNTSIYRNLVYDKLVYGSNIVNLGNVSSSTLINSIANSNLSIKNTSFYSTDISGLYNDSNTINATLIRNFSQPKVSFIQDTPTSITVHVTNATTPYYLVFRETYDPHWAAFYSNGTQVNPRDHIAVNGFANAWYMNKTGNYTITLYYTLQTDAWIAWGVSFAAFFVTVGIGVYGWRGMRHARGVK
ncbi:MAG: hypothetical protein QW346_02030 [Candidatus Micrarchaeaceae archaeon]